LELVAATTAAAGALEQNPHLAELKETTLGSEIMALTRSTNALQDLAVRLRMMSIQGMFQRMKRVAFDVCRASGKRARIILKGAETQVDRGVVENLTGAMVHLIRNAVDHGIEPPAKRREASKPESGSITLQAGREGSEIFIAVSDDGKGLDLERLKQKAAERGLLNPEHSLSDEKAFELVFAEGLSTAQTVTGVSGRGVGMLAVKNAVESLRGRITLQSSPGEGLTVRLTMPLALASVEGLVVRVGGSYYIIPANSMRECFSAQPKDLSTVKGKGRMVKFRDALLPIIHLGKLFAIPFETEDPTAGVLVVTEHRKRFAALLVDEVISSQQVMVRPLDGELAKIDAVSGTASLGVLGLALVLEMSVILKDISSLRANDLSGANKRKDQVETVDIGSNQVGMVDFEVEHLENGKRIRSLFAINAFKAREFVPATSLTPLPASPKGFAGMLLLRDKTIPVVRLVELLGFTPAEDSENIIMICEFGSQAIGMLVSAINRVHYISWAEIKPPPQAHDLVKNSYIVGIILMHRETLFVLDFEHIVQDVLYLYKDFGQTLHGVERRKTGSRILLAEDSAIVRRKISTALQEAGMEVFEAANGLEAKEMIMALLAKVESEGGSIFDHLDLVLSDIEMPELDGYTLTSTIKTHPALMGLPVILQSSLTNETIVKRAKEVHANGVVGKHDPDELALQLKQYL
ncbi:MAG: chemotaxis protein CheW, partial [Planctomycetes bacterium]|nr:chemotaxis protein CheW [Planctomycetota bacterium]